MNSIPALYFYSFIILTIYTVCLLINIWCLSVMLWLVFDVLCFEYIERFINKRKANKRRKKFKILDGDKKDVY